MKRGAASPTASSASPTPAHLRRVAKKAAELAAIFGDGSGQAQSVDHPRLAEEHPQAIAALIAAASHGERVWRRRLGREARALRAARRDASPLVARFCSLEGLDPAVVVDAVLPTDLTTVAAAGHPWRATGMPEHLTALADEAWGPRWHKNAAVLREEHDRRGMAIVHQVGGTLELQIEIGPMRLGTGAGRAKIQIAQVIPETLLDASIGRPVSALISHPLIADPAYSIVSAEGHRRGATVVFHCPEVPLPPVPTGAAAGPARLHVDPGLRASHAVLDLAVRCILEVRQRGSVAPADLMLRQVARAVACINVASPRCRPLPPPTLRQLEIACQRADALTGD